MERGKVVTLKHGLCPQARREDPKALVDYFANMLRCDVLLPEWCPSGVSVEYSQEENVLLIQISMPHTVSLDV